MEKTGSPYENETDNYQQDHYQLFINHELSKKLSLNTAFFLTKGAGYYEQYKAAELYADYGLPNRMIGNETITATDLVRQLRLKNNFYGQVFSAQYKTGKHQLTAGGGWNQYKGQHFGNIIWAENGVDNYPHTWYDLDANKKDLNGYVKYQLNVSPSWFLFGDMQYRNVQYTLAGFRDNPDIRIDNNYHFFNPKAGITYFRNGLKAYLSYAVASKEPNRDDFEAGSTEQPRPEKLHDLELGIERKSGRHSWGITAYHMYYRDQLVLTGMINDVGAYARTNIPHSVRSGIELQGTIVLSRWLQAAANTTLSRNRIRTFTGWEDDWDNGGQKATTYSGSPISFSPAMTSAASVVFRPVENFTVSLLSKYVSKQYLDNTGNENRKLDAYFVQDMRMEYSLRNRITNELTFSLLVSNILNTKYEANGYTYSYLYNGAHQNNNYYFPMAGINCLFALQLKF
jgi:iron complex outermembrane receptor protein